MATTKQAKKPVAKKTSAKKATPRVSVKKIEKSVNETIDGVIEDVNEAYDDVRDEATSIFGKVKVNFSKAQDNYKQTWLAGLGLIGRSADELQARYETMTEERQKLVKELIARGEKIQDDASSRIEESRANLEERFEEAKSRVSKLPTFKNGADVLKDVSDRLETISKKIKKAA